MLYKLYWKGCTTNWKRFNSKVVRNLLQHCSIHCTTNYELLLNIAQYVQYCTKPCTTLFSNQFFNCTIFQLVMHVQPFVQCCTICVQYCAILYRLYRLYNLLYNIVTVWFADEYYDTILLHIAWNCCKYHDCIQYSIMVLLSIVWYCSIL